MPIQLWTGLPGSGKSLSVVDQLRKWSKAQPYRPVFVLGVDGLADGLGQPLTESGLHSWDQLPTGSIVVVDECQKWMPSRRSGDPPAWIRKLSEHRHMGLDFVLVSQHPSLVDTYVRRLVDQHVHYVREFGTKMHSVYRWSACQAEPEKRNAQKSADQRSVRPLPLAVAGLYHSTELDTVKPRIPRKLVLGGVAFVAVPLLVYLAVHLLHKRADRGPSILSASAGSRGASASLVQSDHVMTQAEWLARFTPRVSSAPWSAPAYDGLATTTVPDLYCVEMEHEDGSRTCHCYTEQGTRYAGIDSRTCHAYAVDGVYNPVRPVVLGQPSPASTALPPASVQAVAPSSSSSVGLHVAYQPPAFSAGG
jgi:zona occludens toxin